MPNPTWGNHTPIFKYSGLQPTSYTYYDIKKNCIDFEGMLRDIKAAENGSLFMLHACAHNPTGYDPSKEQWNKLSQVMKDKNHMIFFDCAYQVHFSL